MATAPISSGTGVVAPPTDRDTLTKNFDTFLTLLTEQMKNQDPLSPMDSTQFVNQLVQFSGVEQQINQNDNLKTLIGLQMASQQASASSYLGRDVTVTGADSELKDGEARWSYSLPRAAVGDKLIVQNAEGKIVYAADGKLSSGDHEFVWDGKDNNGAALPDGVYTLAVAAIDADEEKVPASISVSGRVTAVDFASGDPAIMLGNVRASLADVQSLREAAAGGA